MADQRDHIEESVKKAFDGFELGLRDMDWSAIQDRLAQKKRRRRFFWIFCGIGALLLVGAGWWYGANAKQAVTGSQEKLSQEKPLQEKPLQEKPSSAIQTTKEKEHLNSAGIEKSSSKGQQSWASNNGVESQGSTSSVLTKGNGQAGQPETGEKAAKGDGNPSTINTQGDQSAENVDPVVPPFKFERMSGRWIHWSIIWGEFLNQLERTVNLAKSTKTEVKPSIPTPNDSIKKWQLHYWAGLGTMAYGGKASAVSGQEEFANTPYQSIASTLGMQWQWSGGISIEQKKWNFRTGLGVEHRLPQKRNVEYGYWKPTLFGEYRDVNGNLIYRWVRDSVWEQASFRQQIKSTVVYVPLQIERKWALGQRYTLLLGAGTQLGYRIGGRATLANPYLTQDPTWWKYFKGIDAPTTATIERKDALQRFSANGGLWLGVDRKMANNQRLGVQLMGNFGMNQRWVQGLPLKERINSYGIQIRWGAAL